MVHSPGKRTLADKLDHLFQTIRRPNGEQFSYEEVAATITATGEQISQGYIWALRKGKKDNPTYKHLQALADFFGVPPAYFFDDTEANRIDQQLKALQTQQASLATDEAQLVAMRASELTPGRRKLITDLLDVVLREQKAAHEGE